MYAQFKKEHTAIPSIQKKPHTEIDPDDSISSANRTNDDTRSESLSRSDTLTNLVAKMEQQSRAVVKYFGIFYNSSSQSVDGYFTINGLNELTTIEKETMPLRRSQQLLNPPFLKERLILSKESLDTNTKYVYQKYKEQHVTHLTLLLETKLKLFSVICQDKTISPKERNDLEKTWADTALEFKLPERLKTVLKYPEGFDAFENEVTWNFIDNAHSFLWNFSHIAEKFAMKLIELDFVKYFAANLKHVQYLANYKMMDIPEDQSVGRDNFTTKNVCKLLLSSLSVLSNIIRHVPGDEVYEKENIKQAVLPYMASKIEMHRVVAIMILSALLGEGENSKLDDAGSVPFLVNCARKAFASKEKNYIGFSVVETMECIARIAVNDGNKMKLVDKGLLPSLVNMMTSGDQREKCIAAEVTYTLCFDKTVREKVATEPGCEVALWKIYQEYKPKHENKATDEVDGASDVDNDSDDEDKMTDEQFVKEQAFRYADGALWKLKRDQKPKPQKKKKSRDKKGNTKHIFISYSWANQKEVLQIAHKLEDAGFKVWMDVKKMSGSTLGSMADAVENAMVVLICVSERYKNSPNCRAEGEYTFEKRKPVIPLMMQKGYKADGWLGMLLGSKLYINFHSSAKFGESYGKLRKELQNIDEGVFSGVSESSIPTWSKEDVSKWLTDHNIKTMLTTPKLDSLFKDMDGKRLYQLLSMKKEAPEFFYSQFSQKYDMDIKDLVDLCKALDAIAE